MKNFDTCTSFHIDNGAFLGRFIRLDDTINTIIGKHQYPTAVSGVIADCTALAALLANTLKFDGLFTLQIQGNGQIPMVVVDVTSQGLIRSCAKYDETKIKKAQDIRKTSGEIEPTPYFLGAGHLAFTIDQGDQKDLYQGIVELKGKTLSEIALRYFKQSEQIDTYIKLYLKAPSNSLERWLASGILLQKIPSTGGIPQNTEELGKSWEEATIFAESLKDEEVFDSSLSPEDILRRLYHSSSLVISNTKELKFGCRCSREKLADTLQGFKPEDIEEMSENGKISANCNFCSEQYIFDKGELLKQ